MIHKIDETKITERSLKQLTVHFYSECIWDIRPIPTIRTVVRIILTNLNTMLQLLYTKTGLTVFLIYSCM